MKSTSPAEIALKSILSIVGLVAVYLFFGKHRWMMLPLNLFWLGMLFFEREHRGFFWTVSLFGMVVGMNLASWGMFYRYDHGSWSAEAVVPIVGGIALNAALGLIRWWWDKQEKSLLG